VTWSPSPSAKYSNVAYTVLRATKSGGPYKVSVNKWDGTQLYFSKLIFKLRGE
jgi:hypothetical protein